MQRAILMQAGGLTGLTGFSFSWLDVLRLADEAA
jgi:hypothetical protein